MQATTILLLLSTLLLFVSSSPVSRKTAVGEIIGSLSSVPDDSNLQIESYFGIPFAQPPVGKLRWQPPIALSSPLSSPFVADKWNISCPNANWKPSPLCQTCSTRSNYPRLENSEDCLYLNIIVPKRTTPTNENPLLPVLFFVHGGAGTVGASSLYAKDTSAFAKRNVILVTANYRLGILGWLAHKQLSEEQDGISGNYAVLDVVLALQWVKDNIRSFGGDPNQVTIFGQSYGGSAMHYLLLSPKAKGLFHRAIAESGDLDWRFQTQEEVEEQVGNKLFEDLKCDTLECAREKSWEEVLDTGGKQVVPCVKTGGKDLISPLVLLHENSIDSNSVFPEMPFEALKSGRFNRVPLISGHNAHESCLNDYFSQNPYSFFVNKFENETELITAATSSLHNQSPSPAAHSPAEEEKEAQRILRDLYPKEGGGGGAEMLSRFHHKPAAAIVVGGDGEEEQIRNLASIANRRASSSSSSEHHDGVNYHRITHLRVDSGEGTASYAWAKHFATTKRNNNNNKEEEDIPVFHYEFAGAAEGSPSMFPFGAMHLLELTYVFNRTDFIETHAMTRNEQRLAQQMGDFWSDFAKGINPSGWEKCASNNNNEEGGCATNVISTSGNVAHEERWHKRQMVFWMQWEQV